MKTKHPLAAWRDLNGLTQRDFASLVGVDRWTINSIEVGRRKPSLDLTLRISKVTKNKVGAMDLLPELAASMDVAGEAAS